MDWRHWSRTRRSNRLLLGALATCKNVQTTLIIGVVESEACPLGVPFTDSSWGTRGDYTGLT